MLREGYDADVVLLDHDPVAGLDDLTVVATAMDGAFTHGGDVLGG
jgi:imidazolonepropionase-like amidohydrolase